MVEKNLNKRDEIKHYWPGRFNGKNGYLVLSKKRVLFIEEHGIIHRKANLLLDLPYEKISKVIRPQPQLEITMVDGTKRYITTSFPSEVESGLQMLRKVARSKAVDLLLH